MIELKEGVRLINMLRDNKQCPYCHNDIIETHLICKIYNLQEVWFNCRGCDKYILLQFNKGLNKFLVRDVTDYNHNYWFNNKITVKDFLVMLDDIEEDLIPITKRVRQQDKGWKNMDYYEANVYKMKKPRLVNFDSEYDENEEIILPHELNQEIEYDAYCNDDYYED